MKFDSLKCPFILFLPIDNTHLCHSSIDDFLLINYTITIYASLPINSKRFNKEIDLK